LRPIRVAPEAITRASAIKASTHPPAIACPFTAATIGRGQRKASSMVVEKSSMNSRIAGRSSATSEGNAKPALKYFS
jgi:hypothetical protein